MPESLGLIVAAFVGGLLALGGTAFTLLGDRLQWARDRKNWLREIRLQAYTRFLASMDLIIYQTRVPNGPRHSKREHYFELQRAVSNLAVAASEPVWAPANDLVETARLIIRYRRAKDHADYSAKRKLLLKAIWIDLELDKDTGGKGMIGGLRAPK
jgi:hypothetical protein